MNTPSSHFPNSYQKGENVTLQQSPLEEKVKEISRDKSLNNYIGKLKAYGIIPEGSQIGSKEIVFFTFVFSNIVKMLTDTAKIESNNSNLEYQEFIGVFYEKILPNLPLITEGIKIRIESILLQENKKQGSMNTSVWEEFVSPIFYGIIGSLSKEENPNRNAGTQGNDVHVFEEKQNPANETEKKQENKTKTVEDTIREYLKAKYGRERFCCPSCYAPKKNQS